MPEQKQILRISSTDNIRYSVLRLLQERAMLSQLLRCQNTFSRNLMSEICCFM